jgi:hypothetical protein
VSILQGEEEEKDICVNKYTYNIYIETNPVNIPWNTDR